MYLHQQATTDFLQAVRFPFPTPCQERSAKFFFCPIVYHEIKLMFCPAPDVHEYLSYCYVFQTIFIYQNTFHRIVNLQNTSKIEQIVYYNDSTLNILR